MVGRDLCLEIGAELAMGLMSSWKGERGNGGTGDGWADGALRPWVFMGGWLWEGKLEGVLGFQNMLAVVNYLVRGRRDLGAWFRRLSAGDTA